MSDSNAPNVVSTAVEEQLTELVASLVPAKQTAGQRSFRNAIGFFRLAPFCIIVAFLVWPSSPFPARLVWLSQAFILLLAGAWQLDKSNKQAAADSAQRHVFQNSQEARRNIVPLPLRK